MDFRFALRPRWLLGHVIIVVLAAIFLSLASWQHDRLGERREHNDEIRQRMAAPALQLTATADVRELAEYRSVKITGEWDYAHTTYVRYPIQDGIPGYYVLVPFVVDDGAFVVQSGFVSREEGDRSSVPDAGESETVTIEGWVRDYDTTSKAVGRNGGVPAIPTVGAVDSTQLREVMKPRQLADKWIQLTSAAASSEQTSVPGPDLSDGPHEGYMLQWIAFTILAIVGWAAVLWKTADENQTV